jgi:uncharacterized protein (DUF1330 family)
VATVDSIEALLRGFASQPHGEQPVLMLNLLRYRDRADYSDHPAEPARSGREAYRRYAALVMPLIAACGARVQQVGRWQATLIGGPGEVWDDLLMVRYPDREAFLGMLRSDAYRAIGFHRTAALADSRLIAFSPDVAGFQSAES